MWRSRGVMNTDIGNNVTGSGGEVNAVLGFSLASSAFPFSLSDCQVKSTQLYQAFLYL